MCRVLSVSRSGYYDWLRRAKSRRERENEELVREIRHIHATVHGIYGFPKTPTSNSACGCTHQFTCDRALGVEGQDDDARHGQCSANGFTYRHALVEEHHGRKEDDDYRSGSHKRIGHGELKMTQ